MNEFETLPRAFTAHTEGARCELMACAWLLSKGYAVFRNICFSGDIDIIASKGKEVIKIDVKKAVLGKNGNVYNQRLSPQQQEDGVKLLHVINERECFFAHDLPAKKQTI